MSTYMVFIDIAVYDDELIQIPYFNFCFGHTVGLSGLVSEKGNFTKNIIRANKTSSFTITLQIIYRTTHSFIV